ncbi:MAG: hypothetical protein LBQ32_08490 [Burkholderiaceae bacterium]|jgi:hypothetical protein|nr:hypothetical protein [Burkholderiaceae bacterium]
MSAALPRFFSRALRRTWLAALALLLIGCVQPRNIAPGTSGDEVLRSLGAPTARYPVLAGGERLQYSSQPVGQTVYNIDLGPDGRVLRVQQVLDESLFAQRIQPDVWTRADVLREYGPPARTMGVHNFNGVIWVWRYLSGVTWRLLFINVDPAGVVRGWSNGDEDLPEPRRGRR